MTNVHFLEWCPPCWLEIMLISFIYHEVYFFFTQRVLLNVTLIICILKWLQRINCKQLAFFSKAAIYQYFIYQYLCLYQSIALFKRWAAEDQLGDLAVVYLAPCRLSAVFLHIILPNSLILNVESVSSKGQIEFEILHIK